LHQELLISVSSLPISPFVLPESPAEPDLVAKYFRGLGDPRRIRILELLHEHGELSVGELVERGTHHELLGRGGLYATLYEHQFRTGPQPAPA
jgi:hypothetical protein